MTRIISLIVAIFLGLSGCAESMAQTAPAAQTPPVYRLGTDDKLRMVVYGEEQLSGEYIVGSEGTISPPLIGAVKVAGLTPAEAQVKVTEAYATTYVADPKISIDVIEHRPFYILGEVNKSGQYPYRIGMTVMRAVATAEGFTFRANKKKVAIQGEDGVERIVPITSQTLVQPGDTIRVLERYF
ncbi:polysaccharide biosynthesis/export family protein [Sphingobium boeckii]|uniref:Polysaccharide export outer membrane protein n=1 Tax=Sphingobium boeckii TaxID=1082345 RepID=A0A7W9AHZ0_9SPHN|nr:polysaccharide biosynthesis/export family protein [Sphingobium boeckii]MBB5685756.1 polysaccharide export outer membrane protein [Sphingobium boeckii]